MNQGGEPGHDDYGLPRVDIQIPDDARELDRDVQAYHRELRAMRRHERSRRWRAPLRRSGVLVPLIAGCLVLAMIGSMVLTMFSANPNFSGVAGKNPSGPGAARQSGSGPGKATSTAPAVRHGATTQPTGGAITVEPGQQAGVPLPSKTITVAGKPLALHGLTSTALAIIPGHCRCAILIRQLISQARSARVTVYLVGPLGSRSELDSLAPTAAPRTALVAIDAAQVLNTTYKAVGVTLLLVDSHGSVVVSPLRAGFQMERQLQLLKPAH